MKLSRYLLLLTVLACGASSLTAQDKAPAAGKKSGVEARLAQVLKLFPDADANKDGTLSLTEAFDYMEKNPALKATMEQFANAATAEKKVSSKPAEFEPGAKGTRVFVCAHSFMIYTADMLPVIARQAGLSHLKAGQQMIGGSRTVQHWNVPDEKNEAKKALREGRVDVLTVSPHLLLPDAGIDNFTRLGLEKNPALRVYVQASWAPKDGKVSGFTNAVRDTATPEQVRAMRDEHHDGWLKQLEAQVTALNQSTGKDCVRIIPASAAVYALRERIAEGKAPGVTKQSELFRDDLGHPTDVLAVLVTYCHFAAIYQKSPVGLPVPASLQKHPEAEALTHLLQELAWQAVSTYPFSGVAVAAK